MHSKCEVVRGGGVSREPSRKTAPPDVKISTASIDPRFFHTFSLQYIMAFTNAKKRKLGEDTYSATTSDKSHKRHHSDHVPSLSIDFQAAMRPKDRKTAETDNTNYENPSTTPPAKKVSKQQQVSGKASSPSADQALAVKSARAGPGKSIAREQNVFSSSLTSLDDNGMSIADPTAAASEAASTSPSEEASGEEDGSAEEDQEDQEDPDDDPQPDNTKKETIKADDPDAFASSMSAILGSKLTRAQRENPILVRSADAKEAEEALLDLKLEKEAKREMRRKKKLEKNGMDVQPDGERVGGFEKVGSFSAYQQREKELRRTAQKGVIKMFNAFTHVREKTAEVQGLGGSRVKKEEKAAEMTKEGWLEYVGLGGKAKIEENGKGKVEGENR